MIKKKPPTKLKPPRKFLEELNRQIKLFLYDLDARNYPEYYIQSTHHELIRFIKFVARSRR